MSVIKLCAETGFPIGMEIRTIAFSFAVQNGILGFSNKKQVAGYEWLTAFLQQHPEINIRKPEPMSVVRAAGMNTVVIGKWFNSVSRYFDSIAVKNTPT